MKTQAPQLDNRTAEDIYRLLLSHANSVEALSAWTSLWNLEGGGAHFNPKDEGLVLYKIVSKMAEGILERINDTPQKYQLAFYDLLGLELESAASALVPVTFYPAKGIERAEVPRGTRLGSKKFPDVVFETLDELHAWPVKITNSISYNPWSDAVEFHEDLSSGQRQGTGHKVSLFARRENPLSQNMPRRFYLSFGEKLRFDHSAEVELSLKFSGEYGNGQNILLFSKWSAPGGETLEKLSSTTTGAGTLSDPYVQKSSLRFQKNSLSQAGNVSGYWICCEPQESVDLLNYAIIHNLPLLVDANLSVHMQGVFPDYVFVDRAQADFKKGFFPFGEIPKARGAFYIGSTDVLLRKGAQVTLSFDVLNGSFGDSSAQPPVDLNPEILWQYWDGAEWKDLTVTPSANPLNFTGAPETKAQYTLGFECPVDQEELSIGGKTSAWVRGVLNRGSYEIIHSETVNGVTIKRSTYHPPFVCDLKMEYRYFGVAPDKVIAENYDQFQELNLPSPDSPVSPYVVDPEEKPAFYIAFEGVKPDMPVSVLSLSVIKLFGVDEIVIEDLFSDVGPARMQWQYFNGEWVELKSMFDQTRQLEDEGIFSFVAPGDWQESELFQIRRHWIRLQTLPGGSVFQARSIYGLFPNTVYAEAGITLQGETLGSGNGKPGLSLEIPRFPILRGEKLCVIESAVLTQDEMKEIQAEEGDDAVEILTDETTGARRAKVRWHGVKNFHHSTPRSRHYRVDRTNGKIFFGDGERGYIPPAGKKNIFLERYKTAGMKKSNLAAGEIDSLKKAIPGIAKLINHSAATGGRDPQGNQELSDAGPQKIKNRSRVVTLEDYEAMAKEASPDVAGAFCGGYVTSVDQTGHSIPVLIIPQSKEPSPVPSAALVSTVENFIQKNAPAGVASIIEVKSPLYVPVAVSLEYAPLDLMSAPRISEMLEDQIVSFFHPLYGKAGRGFAPGEPVRIFELGKFIEDVEGVDYVSSLSIFHARGYTNSQSASLAPGASGELELAATELPSAAPGEITITLKAGE